MPYTYTIINETTILRSDGACIPTCLGNSDYQDYLAAIEPKAKAPKVVDEATPE
jgi:hypothetical protein